MSAADNTDGSTATIKVDLVEVIRARAALATPGPWGWFGNTEARWFMLATKRWGRHHVMGFTRYGMSGAQPEFWNRPHPHALDRDGDLVAAAEYVKASDAAIYEVCREATSADDSRVYRQDVVGIRNADATFIEHSRDDVDILLAEIDRLRAALAMTAPRVVTSVEELEALPNGTAFVDKYGDTGVWQVGKVFYPETSAMDARRCIRKYGPLAILSAIPRRDNPTPTPTEFLGLVGAERVRHEEKGYTSEHDAEHGVGHLLFWAMEYASRGEHVKAMSLVAAAQDLVSNPPTATDDEREGMRRAIASGVGPAWRPEPISMTLVIDALIADGYRRRPTPSVNEIASILHASHWGQEADGVECCYPMFEDCVAQENGKHEGLPGRSQCFALAASVVGLFDKEPF